MKKEYGSSKKTPERNDHKSSEKNTSREIVCFECGKSDHMKKDSKSEENQKSKTTGFLGSTSESDDV
jgi:hypothetical protein